MTQKLDAMVSQLTTLDGALQEQLTDLDAANHRLENYVNQVTEKCVSLEAHHDLQQRLYAMEKEVHRLKQPVPAPKDNRIDLLMARLEDFENAWSATTLDSVEKTSMRLLAMEQKLETVARTQREYIQRSGAERRSEDRQIETNARTIDIIEEETRSVKRQLTEALALFSKRREQQGSSFVPMTRSRVY